MTSDTSSYNREYSADGSYSLFQFEGSDVISILRNLIEYSFVFFERSLKTLHGHIPRFLNFLLTVSQQCSHVST